MKLFSIKNTKTFIFNPPFVARDVPDAIEVCRKAIITGRDISLLAELENLELYYVGDFSATDASFVQSVNPIDGVCPESICVLGNLPLPEHVQELINKLKKVERDVDKNGIKSFFYKLLNKVEKTEKKKKEKEDLTEEVKE